MSGMSTHLHLIADKAGSYRGSSANISGEGFTGMHFTAKASSTRDFTAWVQATKDSPEHLDLATYNSLVQPSKDNPPAYYSLTEKDLYNQVVMKYMSPDMQGMHPMGAQ
jgi:cytochrome o ubiquinol oxidase subunit 2